jgi:hypothetical protein
MLLSSLLTIPLIGTIIVSSLDSYKNTSIKSIALITSIINLILSLIIFILFNSSTNQFQYIQEHYNVQLFDVYLGVDGISIYFILLTTIIMPIALLSNWDSIKENVKSYLIIMLLLETLLLAVFMALDVMLFYIFFESILPPLFILIGIFGSDNKVNASYYLFLYTFNLKCKRAKFRGHPKALVTKVIREILLPAWLMTQGMVTSLVSIVNYGKLFLIADMWTIADLNHFYYSIQDNKGVKEQRVDGSSNSRNLDFVRCTLVAGKPVLGRRIHSHSDNNILVNNLFKRSLHTTKSTLDPYFVTGLVEAEGSFTISFIKNDRYKMGYQIQGIFKLTMHKKDNDLLCQVKEFFEEGSITKHGHTTLQYTVRSFKSLDKIIAHFDKYPLLSQKYADYLLFKSAVLLIKNKEHLDKKGFMKVLSIRASMNLGLSDELQLAFPDIKPISRPSLLIKNNINPNWIAGLASGDGCFYISIRNSPSTKLGKSIVLKFHIVQHSRDIELMEMLISSLGCGKIELLLKQSAVYFVVVKFQDIVDKIIPLFDKYPIRGVKASDYADFRKVVNIMFNKEHLTEQGLSKIKSIKSNMNLLRII